MILSNTVTKTDPQNFRNVIVLNYRLKANRNLIECQSSRKYTVE